MMPRSEILELALDQAIQFLLGWSPTMLQRGYLAYPHAVDLAAYRGPSTASAYQICAGVSTFQLRH
jgi:hypothetical protein